MLRLRRGVRRGARRRGSATPPDISKERSAVEPVALALLLVEAGLFAPLLEPKIEVDAGAVALEGAHEGFAAEVADEAVDFAGSRGGDDFERQTRAPFGFSSCVT